MLRGMRGSLALLAFTLAACGSPGAPTNNDDDDVTPDSSPPPPDGTVATPDSAQPVAEDCAAYPFKAETLYAERVGFGRNTTGGDWNAPYHVTTLASTGAGSLRVALESTEPYWIVFDVNGMIDLGLDDIHVKSNKTVDGRGRDITIDGEVKLDAGTKNIIFTDVKLQYPEGFANSDGDMISIRGHANDDPELYDSRDMWFHHLELARGGDGQLDNRGATFITVSWSHMHSHSKSMLHTNDTDNLPSRGNRTTYHHNFFNQTSRRGPQFHWGKADFFNNYHYRWYEFGAAGQKESQFLSEANVYEARPGEVCFQCPDPNSPTGDSDFQVSKVALTAAWDTDPGFVKSVGDVARQGAVIEQRMPEVVFDRAAFYPAVIDPADDALIETLETKTGPRRAYCQ
jgi:pectate lyase